MIAVTPPGDKRQGCREDAGQPAAAPTRRGHRRGQDALLLLGPGVEGLDAGGCFQGQARDAAVERAPAGGGRGIEDVDPEAAGDLLGVEHEVAAGPGLDRVVEGALAVDRLPEVGGAIGDADREAGRAERRRPAAIGRAEVAAAHQPCARLRVLDHL